MEKKGKRKHQITEPNFIRHISHKKTTIENKEGESNPMLTSANPKPFPAPDTKKCNRKSPIPNGIVATTVATMKKTTEV
jgi:hypothetical protein